MNPVLGFQVVGELLSRPLVYEGELGTTQEVALLISCFLSPSPAFFISLFAPLSNYSKYDYFSFYMCSLLFTSVPNSSLFQLS